MKVDISPSKRGECLISTGMLDLFGYEGNANFLKTTRRDYFTSARIPVIEKTDANKYSQ